MSVPSRAPAAYEVRVAEDPVDREACFAVRKDVFVAEQKVPEDIEYDAYDADAVHVLAVREDGVPLGTGRLLHGARTGTHRRGPARADARPGILRTSGVRGIRTRVPGRRDSAPRDAASPVAGAANGLVRPVAWHA